MRVMVEGVMKRTILLWLECGGRWLLAGVWCFAAIPKLFELQQFAMIIAAYGLLPDMFASAAALLLPLLELLAAFLLIRNNRAGLLLSGLLLLLFISVLTYGISLGLDIDCGCFGPEDPEHKAFTGLKAALIRDLLLFIPIIYSFWVVHQTKTRGERL